MKDIVITPVKTIDLSDRVSFFSNRRGSLYGCCSRKGIVTLFDSEFNIQNTYDCSDVLKDSKDSIRIFALHPTLDVFGVGGEHEYRIYEFSGMLKCAIQENVEAVYYSPYKNLLWEVKRIDETKKRICLAIDDVLIDCVEIEDELFRSHVMFIPLPDEDKICLEFSAGQDGKMTYILTNEYGKISWEYMKELDYEVFIDFSPDGSKHLSIDPYDVDVIKLYSYPKLSLIKEFPLPWDKEVNDSRFGYSHKFITNQYAMIEMGEDLYYILDTETMSLFGRFIVEGHEPKPIGHYWPRLAKDEGETTDMSVFYKTHKYLITYYYTDRHSREKESLLILDINDIRQKIKEAI